jgi:hypothetical protein
MKNSFFAAMVMVVTLSSQSLYAAIDGYCADEAKTAAEAVYAINKGAKASADSVEAVAYSGYHMKKYEVSIQNSQYDVNVLEFESASNPQCEISSVQAK